ncbi:hypothetical protein COOONC_12130 [Cooperia oncophora]
MALSHTQALSPEPDDIKRNCEKNQVFLNLSKFIINKEEDRFNFIDDNEYSSEWKFAFMSTLALPGLLFFTCFTGVIILSVYTIADYYSDKNDFTRCNEFFSVALQTYGYAEMVISAMFFMTAALFFITGFSSTFICDVIFKSETREFEPRDSFYHALDNKRKIPIYIK